MKRIQRQRTKGWRMPADTVYVGRPSVWGNPWTMRDARDWDIPAALRRWWVVEKYRQELAHWGLMSDYGMYVTDRRWDAEDQAAKATGAKNMAEYATAALAGKDLACWCPLDQPCHADVLLELASVGLPV